MTLADTPLWPHQVAEIPLLLTGHRLLAWEPGTGKTRAILEAFATLPRARRRMLVVVPANVRTQWAEVARDYGFIVQEVATTTTAVDSTSEIVVASYHTIIRPTVFKSAMRVKWSVLTLDEAHYCKTPSTKWTKAIFGARKGTPACLIRRAGRVWLMTGTPMTKDPSDLWVPVSRLFPSILERDSIHNRKQWIGRWCLGYGTPYGFRVTGARDPDQLHALLAPFMSRVKKSEVMPWLKAPIRDRFRLPPRKIAITSEVSSEFREFLEALEGDDPPMADTNPQIATLRRSIGLSKAKEVADLIAEEMAHTDDKALVFFLHTDVGRILFDTLAAAGLDPVLYDGTVSAGARVKGKRRFIEDPHSRVFVGQIQASGTGTDGLQIASRVFIVEEPWTPAALDQIISRAHRGGQAGQVYATSFVVSGSYDDKVSQALERRARMIGAVLDGDNDNHNPRKKEKAA